MTAPATLPADVIDPVEVFRARCAAVAHLVNVGDVDWHDAVDELQATTGPLDADAAQYIMASAFRLVREREWAIADATPAPGKGSKTSFRKSHTVGDATPAKSRTPASTTDTLLYALRRGLSCLDPGNLDRLRRCDEAAVRMIAAKLLTWPGVTERGEPRPWLPPWTHDDVGRLLDVWRSTRGAS